MSSRLSIAISAALLAWVADPAGSATALARSTPKTPKHMLQAAANAAGGKQSARPLMNPNPVGEALPGVVKDKKGPVAAPGIRDLEIRKGTFAGAMNRARLLMRKLTPFSNRLPILRLRKQRNEMKAMKKALGDPDAAKMVASADPEIRAQYDEVLGKEHIDQAAALDRRPRGDWKKAWVHQNLVDMGTEGAKTVAVAGGAGMGVGMVGTALAGGGLAPAAYTAGVVGAGELVSVLTLPGLVGLAGTALPIAGILMGAGALYAGSMAIMRSGSLARAGSQTEHNIAHQRKLGNDQPVHDVKHAARVAEAEAEGQRKPTVTEAVTQRKAQRASERRTPLEFISDAFKFTGRMAGGAARGVGNLARGTANALGNAGQRARTAAGNARQTAGEMMDQAGQVVFPQNYQPALAGGGQRLQ